MNREGNARYLWMVLRLKLHKKARGKCQWCHTELTGRFEIHHLNGNGLDNNESNLAVLCSRCHGKTRRLYSPDHQLKLALADPNGFPKLPLDALREEYNRCFPRL